MGLVPDYYLSIFSHAPDPEHPHLMETRVSGLSADSLADVYRERVVQRREFTPADDDTLEPAEWIARIAKHLGRAVTQDPETFRRELVIVGALALAGIESYDRRYA